MTIRLAAESELTDLDHRLEALRAFEREYRARLRGYLHQQLIALDKQAGRPPGVLQVMVPAQVIELRDVNDAAVHVLVCGLPGEFLTAEVVVPGRDRETWL